MWLLLHLIADKIRPEGKQFSAESFHLFFKSRFLGCDDVRLPNGKTMPVPRSSADLPIDEFADYMTKIEAWASERGVYLEDMPA